MIRTIKHSNRHARSFRAAHRRRAGKNRGFPTPRTESAKARGIEIAGAKGLHDNHQKEVRGRPVGQLAAHCHRAGKNRRFLTPRTESARTWEPRFLAQRGFTIIIRRRWEDSLLDSFCARGRYGILSAPLQLSPQLCATDSGSSNSFDRREVRYYIHVLE